MTIAKKTIATTLALSIAGALLPATAQADDYHGYYGHQPHYRHYRGGDDLGAAVATGIIGFAAGAIVGSALSEPEPVYVAPQPIYHAPPPVLGQTYRYSTDYPRPLTVEPLPVYAGPPPPPPGPAPAPPRVNAGSPQPFTPEWYAYCSRKYRSFDPATGTFQPYHGPRRLCR